MRGAESGTRGWITHEAAYDVAWRPQTRREVLVALEKTISVSTERNVPLSGLSVIELIIEVESCSIGTGYAL